MICTLNIDYLRNKHHGIKLKIKDLILISSLFDYFVRNTPSANGYYYLPIKEIKKIIKFLYKSLPPYKRSISRLIRVKLLKRLPNTDYITGDVNLHKYHFNYNAY